MAIINNNLQNVKFLRNGNLFANHEAALTGIQNEFGSGITSTSADGTAILARYTAKDTTVKTLVGFIYFADADHKSLTILDVEGASGDVNALRQEINAKLGTEFISSANTVEANLTALSGDSVNDTSATTSVEGAKKYAKDYTDAEIDKLDYSGVTTGTGVYVTNVTEVNGIISATTAELPTVTGEVESKKVVMSVSENKGEISYSKGTIESSDKTVTITDVKDGEDNVTGIDFAVNIDGVSIVKDANGVLKVADTALTQYYGDETTIHATTDATANTKTFSSLLTVAKTTTGLPTNVLERYNLVDSTGATIGANIDIYKDSALVNFYLGHVDDLLSGTTAQTEESESSTVVDGTGDTALVYVMQLANGKYKLTAVNVESFLEESEFADGLSVANHVVKVSADTTSEKVITAYNNDGTSATTADVLTVSASGVKVDNIQAAINAKIGTLDATVNNNANSGHVAVEITEVDGKLTDVTVTEDDIASQDKLDELSGKTLTEVESSNSSISAVTTAATDGTVKVDLTTDASKIKMTGFTAETSGLTAVTSASTVTEAVKAIETEIIANEQTTAAALADLDGRLDTVEAEYISGATVNNVALTPSNKVLPISIQAATTATTASTANAIVVDTDSTTGAITLGLNYIDCGTY